MSISIKNVNLIGLAVGLALSANIYAATSTVNPVPAMAGYFPIQIQNNIGSGATVQGVTNVYLLFTGKQMNSPNPQCLLQLPKTPDSSIAGYNAWVATCDNISMSTRAADFSYSMASLQPNVGEPVIIYVPNMISGRAFVSLNYPLDIPMTLAADGTVSIQAPSLSNTADGNYNLIYDKFEYTYDNTNTFWIDTTSVDDFGLPIALAYTDLTTHVTQNNGYTGQTRHHIIHSIENILDNSGNSDWSSLIVTSVDQYKTILRIDAPNTSPTFNNNYLTSSTGFNYLNTLSSYYSNPANAITIDCSEVDAKKYPEWVQLGSGTDPNAYVFTGSVNQAGKWVFNNAPATPADSMAVTIDLNQATSGDFFGPGQVPLDTPDGTVRSVIVKYITSAFSVGFLPMAGDLNASYFENNKSTYYTPNTVLSGKAYVKSAYAPGEGPWFDLYAQAIHKTSANPVYAFAFDDVLKQDGTISVNNNSPGATVEPVLITFGDVGDLHVPAPGPNYNEYPHANNVFAAQKVTLTNASCTTSSCTMTVNWTNPKGQDGSVKYFALPTPSPVATSVVFTAPSFELADSTATSQTITFPLSPKQVPAPVLVQASVYACIPSDTASVNRYECPNALNKYIGGHQMQGASSPAPNLQLQAVTITGYGTGFTCGATSCALTATWTIPKGQPSSAVYYINPIGNTKASMPDIMSGQSLGSGSSGTLTLPVADVNQPAGQIVVSTCANEQAVGKECPSSANSYNASSTVGSVPFPVN